MWRLVAYEVMWRANAATSINEVSTERNMERATPAPHQCTEKHHGITSPYSAWDWKVKWSNVIVAEQAELGEL